MKEDRKIVSIHPYQGRDDGAKFIAVADDGTAWKTYIEISSGRFAKWEQLPPLPQREVPYNN